MEAFGQSCCLEPPGWESPYVKGGGGGHQPICSWEKEVTESPAQRRVLARPSTMPGPLGCSWANPGELAGELRQEPSGSD